MFFVNWQTCWKFCRLLPNWWTWCHMSNCISSSVLFMSGTGISQNSRTHAETESSPGMGGTNTCLSLRGFVGFLSSQNGCLIPWLPLSPSRCMTVSGSLSPELYFRLFPRHFFFPSLLFLTLTLCSFIWLCACFIPPRGFHSVSLWRHEPPICFPSVPRLTGGESCRFRSWCT